MATARKTWLLQEFGGSGTAISTLALGQKSARVLATGGEDGQVNLFAVGNPSVIMSFTGHTSSIESLTFNGSEELICAGARSGQLKIWDISASKVVRNLTGHKAAVSCLDFHSYGEFVASGSLDNKVRMWDVRRKGCIFTYTGHEGSLNALQFSPDGRWVASCSEDSTCKIWDLTAGKLLHQFKEHGWPVTCLHFHPRELLLVTGSADKTVRVYDVEQFRMVSSSNPQTNGIRKVAFSENGSCVFSVSQDTCHVYTWEPESRCIDSLIVRWGRPCDIAVSSQQLISASFLKNIVSNHVIDLSQLRTSLLDPPVGVQQPISLSVSDSAQQNPRPLTSCSSSLNAEAKPIQIPKPPQAVQVNHNNNLETSKSSDVPKEDLFWPRNTLSRSPSDNKPKNLPLKEERYRFKKMKEQTPSPHQATNILPHLTPDPVPIPKEFPLDPPDKKPPHLVTPKLEKAEPIASPIAIPTNDLHDLVKKEPYLLPVKPESNHPPTMDTLNDTLLSTIVPSNREDPVGLDMNAFLPVKKEPVLPNGSSSHNETLSDSQIQYNIKKGSESMKIVLTARFKNLEIVRAMWSSSDVMVSMSTAVRMTDQALLVDLLGVLNMKSSLWTLELCQVRYPYAVCSCFSFCSFSVWVSIFIACVTWKTCIINACDVFLFCVSFIHCIAEQSFQITRVV